MVVIDAQGKQFLISLCDAELIKDKYWSVGYNGYVHAFENNEKISLHRFLCPDAGDYVIDHINHDESDNRRENIRICKTQQNTMNKTLPRNNKTGVIGVCQEKTRTGYQWRAYITINGKNVKLYRGDSFDSAVHERLKAEQENFGEFAPQKHLYQQYGIEVESSTN